MKCPKCGRMTRIDYERFEGTTYWCPRCKRVVKRVQGN
jgi:predicted RNA-binding Zn-ribbon protein involved in translation (DUF1610 family)